MNRKEHLQKIKDADAAYYDGTEPLMSDAEYDILRAAYIAKYGTEDLDYVPGKSITTRRFKHPIEVTSLAKVDEDDTKKFDTEIKRLSPVVIEPKYDGLTIVAYPDGNGSYFYVTRGSGTEGDILPYFEPDNTDKSYNSNTKYAIRGEAYMRRDAFNKMNEDLIKKGEKPKANPRNAVAGILNPARKDKSPYMHLVTYMCYDVIGMDAPESEKLRYILDKTPFEEALNITMGETNTTPEDIRKEILSWHKQIIKDNDMPIDGMVIKTDQKHSLEKWGSTAHHPRNATAIKVAQLAVKTTLQGVHWQLGKTGALTPVADFDPIEILGSTVSQASLSNSEEIKRLNLHIGDEIAVIKAKEIIPKIVMSYGGGKKEIDIPDFCPFCDKPLSRKGPVLYCENPYCHERLAQQLAFMASKKALDIPGLFIETCRQMVSCLKFEDICLGDLLWIKKEDYLHLDGVKDKKAQKLSDAMRHAMDMPHPFRNWLSALCFDGIGYSVADALIARYGTVEGIEKALFDRANKEEIEAISSIGKVTAEALLSQEFHDRWIWFKENFPIQEIKQKLGKTLPFTDKSFALTGKMPQPRSYYEKLIEENGGTVVSSVSRNTTYLVIADTNSTSSKTEKARKLGTKLITPDDLIEMTQKS